VARRELSWDRLQAAERYIGEIVLFPRSISERMNQLGLFNRKMGFQYTRTPYTMLRESSGLVYRALFGSHVQGDSTFRRRVIVAGKEGTGKTWILMQLAALAMMQDYIVITVPQGCSQSSQTDF
jgi:Mitochondrial ribosomal death-associated protein 3